VISSCGPAELERFRSILARALGWSFDDTKLQELSEVLVSRSDARGLGIDDYLHDLEVDASRAEQRELARRLTVGETYFFRNAGQFQAFAEVALADRLVVRARERKLNLLSAGCASGEEPYSMAILVRERGIDSRWDVSIRAVDVSPAALERAARGRYSPWSLRETSQEARQRWFTPAGSEFALDPGVVSMVQFEDRNLAEDDPELWPEGAYDVVFCRNLMMYFTPDQAMKLVDRIARATAPGGYLYLGHAETLRGVSQSFHLCHTHGTFYYRRHDSTPRRADLPSSISPRPAFTAAPVDPAWATTWLETVRRASERIHSLAERSSASPPPAEVARHEVDAALELFKSEHFGEALSRLGDPDTSSSDPSVLLLRAVLLTHQGEVEAAETACSRLLELDELNAGAHYVLALCRESAGDRAGAIEHDQIASYLDPAFAMPRLHLGLLARRAGDREAASRDLAQAASLLQREEPSRLLLFGGGFRRDGLVALCRSELAKLGANP